MKSKNLHNNLTLMVKELRHAPKLYRPSEYWETLNDRHISHLNKYGIKCFKRSINKEYFDWGPTGIIPYQLAPIFSEIIKGNILPLFQSKFIEEGSSWKPFHQFQFLSKLIYKIYVAYIYDYTTRIDHFNILKKISEPKIGAPLLIKYRNKCISQNLVNSVQEFYSITKQINVKQNLEIAEIGAGYGRLAYVFLKTLPLTNYCIIDIPPALYVSQTYLQKLFPKDSFFFFRHFDNFNDVKEDFTKARIKFLMPHQIPYLPDNLFNIAINISSFHEIRRDQIKNYIQQIDRLTNGYFYFKQWKKSNAKDNDFMREDEYPIPSKWEKIYHHTDPIHSLFFEALYKTRKSRKYIR